MLIITLPVCLQGKTQYLKAVSTSWLTNSFIILTNTYLSVYYVLSTMTDTVLSQREKHRYGLCFHSDVYSGKGHRQNILNIKKR